jgi:dolichyl-phosphate-mannose--protein O-mannosyl transferase
MYGCARRLGCTVLGASLACIFMIFDMLNIGEGRLILMDAQLIFWLLATLYAATLWWSRLNAEYHAEVAAAKNRTLISSSFRISSLESFGWCVLIGILCGCAIGVKMTGLVTPAVIAVESYLAIWTLHRPVPFHQLLLILFISMATYSLWFAGSFILMTHSQELKMEQEFMTPLVCISFYKISSFLFLTFFLCINLFIYLFFLFFFLVSSYFNWK